MIGYAAHEDLVNMSAEEDSLLQLWVGYNTQESTIKIIQQWSFGMNQNKAHYSERSVSSICTLNSSHLKIINIISINLLKKS
jgi:hypothetical protein